jgi:hypothetical protein
MPPAAMATEPSATDTVGSGSGELPPRKGRGLGRGLRGGACGAGPERHLSDAGRLRATWRREGMGFRARGGASWPAGVVKLFHYSMLVPWDGLF